MQNYLYIKACSVTLKETSREAVLVPIPANESSTTLPTPHFTLWVLQAPYDTNFASNVSKCHHLSFGSFRTRFLIFFICDELFGGKSEEEKNLYISLERETNTANFSKGGEAEFLHIKLCCY